MTSSEGNNKQLFKDIKFFLVEDNNQVKQILKDGGGQKEFFILPVANLIIADTCNFPKYEEAVESNLPIVTSAWVHMCIKCDSLLPYTPFSPKKDKLFFNLVISVSQIPASDRSSLLAMISYYGGKYSITLTNDCTHLVVGKPSGKKYEAAVKNKMNIVTPDWITDSIQKNALQPVEEYEPITNTTGGQAMKSTPKKPTTANVSSAFMTPVTPGQITIADQVTPHHGGKENFILDKSVNSHQYPPDLLSGFKIYFCDYEERLHESTFAIWKAVIKKASGVVMDSYGPEVTHVLCLHQQSLIFKKAVEDRKKIATAYWLNDVLLSKRVFQPSTPLHLPVPFTDTIAGMMQAVFSVTGYEDKTRNLVKHMVNFLGAKYTGYLSRNHSYLVCRVAKGVKYEKAMEWGIPVVNAKWLGDMIQTGQSFPCKGKSKYSSVGIANELSINPTFSSYITEIWEESKSQVEKSNPNVPGDKRKMSESEDDPTKEKQRKLNPNVKRVLFTGLTGTTVHRLRQNVLKLKGELAKGVNDCTHLVAPKITRTVKFLSAVSICKFLVAPSWVDESFEAKSFLEESNFTLVDPESEELFGFKLKRSLQRAQTRQVCKGLHFHVTPSILPAPNSMREIIECAGGKMTEVKTVEEVVNVFVNNAQNDMSYNSYLVSCVDDKQLWADIVKEGYDIYNVELILSGVMKQELEWNLHHL